MNATLIDHFFSVYGCFEKQNPRRIHLIFNQLFDYVREKVREETNDSQHPSLIGDFDRDLHDSTGLLRHFGPVHIGDQAFGKTKRRQTAIQEK